MTFLHTRSAGALVSRCTLCGHTIASRFERDVYLGQRSHDAWSCQMARVENARAEGVEQRIARALFDADESVRLCCGSVELGVAQGRMEPAMTNRPTRERRTVLSTPSATNGKEAVGQ